jgi:predicted exporter
MRRAGIVATLLWAALALVAAVIVARASYTADLSAFLPRSPTATERVLVQQLREGLAARLIMVAVSGADSRTRAQVVAGLAQRLRANPAFVAVNDGDPMGFDAAAQLLFEHRYLLSEAVTAQRFSVAGLHAAIGNSLDLLTAPEGLLFKPRFTRDPTGETPAILDSLAGPSPRTLDGVWSSPDGQRALLLAETRAVGSDIDAQEAAAAAVSRDFAAAAAATPAAPGRVSLRMGGPGVFAVSARSTIRDQVIRLSLVGSLLIAALLLAVLRSVRALLLTFVPVASGALAGVAALTLGFDTVHGITLAFGVTLIGEAIDYSIYWFLQSRPDSSGDGARDGWKQGVWPTIRLGMLTSVCGFAALLPSAFQGVAQLGLFSIAGLVTAALVTRFVLPEWVHGTLEVRNLAPFGAALAQLLTRLRPARAALLLVPVLAAVVLYAHRHTLLSRELSSLSPTTSQEQAADAALRADVAAPDARYMIAVSARDLQRALSAADAVGARLTRLVDDGVIGGFESPTHYLPSLATQRVRQASLPPPAELAVRLGQALAGLPVSAARLAPFLQDVEAARTARLLTRADFAGTPLAPALDALLDVNAAGATAFLPITPADGGELSPAAIERLTTAAAAAAPGEAQLLDLKAQADRLYAGYLRQATKLSLAGFAAIVVLLLVARLSPLRVLRVVAPLALAVLAVAGLLVVFGERLGIMHVVGMLLIVAVGSNYALFFDRMAGRPAAAAPLTLASLLVANLATVIGFGVLACSSVPVLAALGRTVAPGALLALLFAALMSRSAEVLRSAAPPSPT